MVIHGRAADGRPCCVGPANMRPGSPQSGAPLPVAVGNGRALRELTRKYARTSAAASRMGSCTLGAMVCGTNGRAASLLLALAWTPACASGAGFGEESTAGSTGGTGTSSGAAETTGEPPNTETTDGPDPSTSTSAPTTTGEETLGESSTGESNGGDETTTGDDLPHPELYPTDRTHSPITAYVADSIRAIAQAPGGADKNPAVFAKIGGGSTASVNFMGCFAVEAAIQDLPPAPPLQDTLGYFNSVDLGGVTAFNRASAAAMVGFSSDELVSGAPTPIEAELEAIKPRFAQLLVGTHDLEKDQPGQLWTFAENLLTTVNALTTQGVVPIISTIPQRTDLPAKDIFTPRYNLVLRAVAQGRQIPLVDLNLALMGVPMAGVVENGELSVFVSAMVDRPCHFGELAMMYGYNVRNLEGLRSLDRARQVVVDKVAELDAPGKRLEGVGSMADPIEIPSLPFVDLRSTEDSPSDIIDNYLGACDGMKDESGPERFYRLEVAAPVNVRVMVFDREAVDVDVHVLSDLAADKCLKRNDREITGPLPPGIYYIAVDSFAGDVPGGAVGEYAIVVMAD